MNKGSIVERLCSDLDRKEPRYKSPTLLLLIVIGRVEQMLWILPLVKLCQRCCLPDKYILISLISRRCDI